MPLLGTQAVVLVLLGLAVLALLLVFGLFTRFASAAVVIFMIATYGIFGVFANVAVAIYPFLAAIALTAYAGVLVRRHVLPEPAAVARARAAWFFWKSGSGALKPGSNSRVSAMPPTAPRSPAVTASVTLPDNTSADVTV